MLKCALLSWTEHFKAVIPLLWSLQGNFVKYGALACDFCVHQKFYFSIGGSTCNSSNMEQMAQESVNQLLLRG
jgi:hypothetical protein